MNDYVIGYDQTLASWPGWWWEFHMLLDRSSWMQLFKWKYKPVTFQSPLPEQKQRSEFSLHVPAPHHNAHRDTKRQKNQPVMDSKWRPCDTGKQDLPLQNTPQAKVELHTQCTGRRFQTHKHTETDSKNLPVISRSLTSWLRTISSTWAPVPDFCGPTNLELFYWAGKRHSLSETVGWVTDLFATFKDGGPQS